MHRWKCLILASVYLLTCFGCGADKKSVTDDAPETVRGRVAVTNYPLFCMASSICRDESGPVKELIYVGPPNGADAHSLMPSTSQIRDLQNVDLIVCNGHGAVFANWMDKVTINQSKLCETTEGIKLSEFVIVKDYQLVHSHGPEGEHSHSWIVSQSWLSPKIARKQATLMFKRLVTVYGESHQLDNGFAELQKQFDQLEAAAEKIQSDHPDHVVTSSTPDIQYLTRNLGWTDHYLQWTEPRSAAQGEKEIADMRARIANEGSKPSQTESLFLWSGAPVEGVTAIVDAQWPANVTIDLIDSPGSDDIDPNGYFERMASNLDRIGSSLE